MEKGNCEQKSNHENSQVDGVIWLFLFGQSVWDDQLKALVGQIIPWLLVFLVGGRHLMVVCVVCVVKWMNREGRGR